MKIKKLYFEPNILINEEGEAYAFTRDVDQGGRVHNIHLYNKININEERLLDKLNK